MMSGASHKRILLVEDDAALARLLTMTLEAEGFLVQSHGLGAAALRDAAEHRVDLVILDLRLPDMSGYEVAKALRSIAHPWVMPILMLTALGTPADQLRGFAHGADAYLIKPCDPEELLRTVHLLLGETANA